MSQHARTAVAPEARLGRVHAAQRQPRIHPLRGISLGFGLFWNGFPTLMVWMTDGRTSGPSPETLYAIVSPFALAGVFLLGLAITVTVTLIRYRSLQLRLDTLPGLVGGRIAGSLQGADGVLREGMSLRLACGLDRKSVV